MTPEVGAETTRKLNASSAEDSSALAAISWRLRLLSCDEALPRI